MDPAVLHSLPVLTPAGEDRECREEACVPVRPSHASYAIVKRLTGVGDAIIGSCEMLPFGTAQCYGCNKVMSPTRFARHVGTSSNIGKCAVNCLTGEMYEGRRKRHRDPSGDGG